MPESKKTPVIDRLWDMLQEEGKGRLYVTADEVKDAIRLINKAKAYSKPLSLNNPANFMKDVVRKDNVTAWPERLCRMRIGGRQRVGQTRVLEFAPYKPGQTEPFPNRYMPAADMVATQLQSLSMPLASKSLGRKDESWLVQVSVHLNVIEQHFALHDSCKVREITHLQTGVKLGGSEVDSLFRAVIERPDKTLGTALVTCEAKQHGERILEDQIIEQIGAASSSVQSSQAFDIDLIIPIAIKAIGPNGHIYLVEFKPWTPAQASVPEDKQPELQLASEALYQLVPAVKGVGFYPRQTRAKKKA